MSAFPPVPGVLPTWESERLSLGDAQAWFRAARPCLRPDWIALVDGAVPRSLLKYTARVAPTALALAPPLAPGAPSVADTGTPAQVAARDTLIAQIAEENALRLLESAAHEAEIRYEFFLAIDFALRLHAPLLLQHLQQTFPLAYNNAWVDGPKAYSYLHLTFAGANAVALRTEDDSHDDHMVALRLKPLLDNASPLEFSERVNDALTHHIPFLVRPFPAGPSKGRWVINQLPDCLASDGRRLLATLTPVELADASLVARRCVDIVSSAHRPDMKLTGPLAPFLGAMTNGRRPRGLDGNNKKAADDKGGNGKSAGRSDSSRKADGKAVNCSVTAPRGPMCQWPHKGPCYRDPSFAGPLPLATWENADRMARISADRTANATRLGEKVVPLIPPKSVPIGAAILVADVQADTDNNVDTDHPLPSPPPMLEFDEASFQLLSSAQLRFDARLASDPDVASFVSGTTFEAIHGQDSVQMIVTSVQTFSSFGSAWNSLRDALVTRTVASLSSTADADGHFQSYYDFPIDKNLSTHHVRVFGVRPVLRPPLPVVTRSSSEVGRSDTVASSVASSLTVKSSSRGSIVAAATDIGDAVHDDDEPPVLPPDIASLHVLAGRWACLLLFVTAVVFFSAVHGFVRVFLDGLHSGRALVDHGIVLWTHHFGLSSLPDPYIVYGCLTTVVVIACAPLRLPVLAARATRRIYHIVHANVFSFILIIFIWVCVARAHGLSDPTMSSLQSVLRHERHNTLLQDQFRMASSVLEAWTNVVVIYDVHCDDGTVGDSDIVGDTGAMRSVFRDPSIFVPESIRPCPFHVRGVGGQSTRPKFIGDARVPLRTADGTVVIETIHDAVCLESCPHDLLSLGRLARSGATVHISPTEAHLVLRGGSIIPMRNVSVLLIHSTPAAPATAVNVATATPLLSHPCSHALYICSGKSGRLGSFGSVFRDLGGARCDDYDKRNGAAQDLTIPSVRARVLTDIRSGKYDCVLLSPPCNTFSVVRLKSLFDYPVLRTFHHILGVPGLYALPPRYSFRVIDANAVCELACDVCVLCHSLGIPFVLENPVQCSDNSGPWKAFHSSEFSDHGSFWQLPCSERMLHVTGSLLAHVPMCFWGADRQHYTTLAFSPLLARAADLFRLATCTHASHPGSIGSSHVAVSLLRSDGEFTNAFCKDLASMLRLPLSIPLSVDRLPSRLHDTRSVLAGMPGDGRPSAATSVIRGRRQRASNVTSTELHLTFGHAPADVLRYLPRSSADAPEFWKDVLSEPCDACLRAKATRLSSARSHVCTHAGEIISIDLWSCRVSCLVGGEQLVFGAVDNCSTWGDLTKLRFKTQVPDAIANLIAVCASLGVTIERLHTDNENIFHSPDARESTISRYRAQGILITTGCEYESNQNSPIERYWRTCANDARASMAVWNAEEGFLPLALVDASTKRNVIPYADAPDSCPSFRFSGRKPNVMQFRPFGCEVFMRLPHTLNDSRVSVSKGADRAVRGLSLTYGRDGTLHDRRRPGWGVLVPEYRYNKLLFSSHCTFKKGSFPGLEGVRRPAPPPAVSHERHSVQIQEDGSTADADAVNDGHADDDDPAMRTPDVDADTQHAVVDPTTAVDNLPVSRRLPTRASPSPYMSHRGVGAVFPDPPPVTSLRADLVASASSHPVPHPPYVPVSFHPDVAGHACPGPCSSIAWPVLDAPPPAPPSDPAPRSAPGAPDEEFAFLSSHDGSVPVERRVLRSSPSDDVLVSFAWGDVPYSWANGFGSSQLPYDSCIDNSVMASFDDDDSPSYNAAMKSNERQHWESAFRSEVTNLERFGVIGRKVPADEVPRDRDIYDIVVVCKRKRGSGNTVTRYKVRFCLNGAQMNQSAAQSVGDFRTMSPTLMHRTFKYGCAAAVCKGASRTCFDVVGAYLQGKHKNGYVVYVRAPVDAREYDERGVELIWELVGPLYGEPDAGRVWYNTLSDWLIETEHFSRSVGDPCHFYFVTPVGDIQLDIYVDDGNIFDTDAAACASFLARLRARFEVLIVPDNFYLGMDVISSDHRVIKLSNASYIHALVHRELPDGVSGYRQFQTPASSRLIEFYEAALVLRAVPEPSFHRRYRSLVGGLCWLGPTARPDVLYATGICARAFSYPTQDLYDCAIRILVYCYHTASLGITFSAHSPDAALLVAYSDSDWSVQRSTSGGCLLLAGGCVHAVSRKQECTTTSTAHAEIVSASSLASDIEHARRFLSDLNLDQSQATVLHVDNKAVFDVSRNYSATKNLRHLDRRAFRVRDLCFAHAIEVRLVPTANMVADIFTKALDRTPFFKFRQVLLNVVNPSASFLRIVGGVFFYPSSARSR